MLQHSASDPAAPETSAASAAGEKQRPALEIDPQWRAGKKLSEARRQLGFSLQQAADRIKVRSEFLAALEAMNVKPLPGKAYAVAYLKSYAKLLGLDPEAISEQFQSECALSREDAQPQLRPPTSRPHPERPWLAAAALVSLGAGLVIWRALASATPPAPEAAPAEMAAAVSAPSQSVQRAPAAAPAARREIAFRALAEAWLEARGPDGTVFLSRTFEPGEVYRPDPSPGWKLHARDGGAFEVLIDGVSAGPLGEAGKPVLGRPIDEILETQGQPQS